MNKILAKDFLRMPCNSEYYKKEINLLSLYVHDLYAINISSAPCKR